MTRHVIVSLFAFGLVASLTPTGALSDASPDKEISTACEWLGVQNASPGDVRVSMLCQVIDEQDPFPSLGQPAAFEPVATATRQPRVDDSVVGVQDGNGTMHPYGASARRPRNWTLKNAPFAPLFLGHPASP